MLATSAMAATSTNNNNGSSNNASARLLLARGVTPSSSLPLHQAQHQHVVVSTTSPPPVSTTNINTPPAVASLTTSSAMNKPPAPLVRKESVPVGGSASTASSSSHTTSTACATGKMGNNPYSTTTNTHVTSNSGTTTAPAPALHRIYRAPQASVRNERTFLSVVQEPKSAGGSGNARQRRRPSGHRPRQQGGVTAASHQSNNNNWNNDFVDALSAPRLWQDDMMMLPDHNTSATAASSTLPHRTAHNHPGGTTSNNRSNTGNTNHESPPRMPRRGYLSLRPGHDDDYSDKSLDINEDSLTTGNTFYSPDDTYIQQNNSFSELGGMHGGTNSNHLSRRKSHLQLQYMWHCYRSYFNYQNVLQFIVLIVLGVMIFDSHHRVHKHKSQLKQYDEERAHILEQMMWIDKAAKKVHKQYAQKDIWNDVEKESKDQLRSDVTSLREQLDVIQRRIQTNAREYLQRRFGNGPLQISLSIDENSIDGAAEAGATNKQHIVIGLSDDTPHAASVLVQQVDSKMWETIELQQLRSGAIQVTTAGTDRTIPLLECVEKSRSCKETGAVSIHQLEMSDMVTLVVRVHVHANIEMEEDDVCIGKVIHGLDVLQQMHGLPVIDAGGGGGDGIDRNGGPGLSGNDDVNNNETRHLQGPSKQDQQQLPKLQQQQQQQRQPDISNYKSNNISVL